MVMGHINDRDGYSLKEKNYWREKYGTRKKSA